MGEIIEDLCLFRGEDAADLFLSFSMCLAELRAERFAKFINVLMTLLGQLSDLVFLFLTQFEVAIEIPR